MVQLDSDLDGEDAEKGVTYRGLSATNLVGLEAGHAARPHDDVKTQAANRVGNHCFHYIITVH